MVRVRRKGRGFSLIELLVAVAITAVIIVMASSLYTKYLAKQMVIKAIAATANLRQAVEDYYQLYGYLPGNMDLIDGPGAPYITNYADNETQPTYYFVEPDLYRISYYNSYGAYCSSGQAGCDGTGNTAWRQIEVSFANATSLASKYLANNTFILRINLNGGVITWECAQYAWNGSGSGLPVPGEYLPASCYNSALNI
jgi:prepilin-type N-terminal cleavage/methylation domain-containing protein